MVGFGGKGGGDFRSAQMEKPFDATVCMFLVIEHFELLGDMNELLGELTWRRGPDYPTALGHNLHLEVHPLSLVLEVAGQFYGQIYISEHLGDL